METLYERDLYAWATRNAALLRAGRWAEVDRMNIAEELESMGRSERRALGSRLAVLLMHWLKWRYQPERRGRSWRATIREQQRQVARLLVDNPSLRPRITDAHGGCLHRCGIDGDRRNGFGGDAVSRDLSV
jgi:hypothetical protein